ncbi:MAG: glycosyltransferase family 1 protein [Bacteroidales bacterium]|nr:glycosyltransferase family 1 protein [Bacteroidales bacterium]
MKIAINTRLLINNKLDGIGWFSFETLKRITQNHPEHQFYFLFDRPFGKEFIFSSNIEPIVIGPPARHPVLWYLWFEHRLPGIISKLGADLFVSPDGYLSLNSKIPSLAVIHDINFLHFPEDLPWSSRWFYNYYFPRYAQKATRLATVSEYSKNDLVKNYHIRPDNIDVLYNGYNEVYQPINEKDNLKVKERYTNGCDFFIFIGSLHPRKNVANMLKAFDKFKQAQPSKIKFVIVGEHFFKTRDIKNALDLMHYKEDVLFVGRQEPVQLRDLLASAISLVLVSKFEGFGIPVIESLKCNTPVIVSNVTSLPEVAGNAAIYAEHNSVDSIANAMLKMAADKSLRKKLIENGRLICQKYSWDKTASLFWESIVKAINA